MESPHKDSEIECVCVCVDGGWLWECVWERDKRDDREIDGRENAVRSAICVQGSSPVPHMARRDELQHTQTHSYAQMHILSHTFIARLKT